MRRRNFLASLLAFLGLAGETAPAAAHSARRRAVTLQASPIAGFQYYDGETVSRALCPGCVLTLVREPGNPYDGKAVRVEWQGRKLGYVPRSENHAIAQLLDRGEQLSALVVELKESTNPWDRVRFAVVLHA